MADAFGNNARNWAGRLPENVPWILADYERANAGLAHAATLKRAGNSIAATLLLPNPRAAVAAAYGMALLNQTPAYDEREMLFTALAMNNLKSNDVEQRDWIKFDNVMLAVARDFLRSCDIWVTRSTTEMQRLSDALRFLPTTILTAALLDPLVFPAVSRRLSYRDRGLGALLPT